MSIRFSWNAKHELTMLFLLDITWDWQELVSEPYNQNSGSLLAIQRKITQCVNFSDLQWSTAGTLYIELSADAVFPLKNIGYTYGCSSLIIKPFLDKTAFQLMQACKLWFHPSKRRTAIIQPGTLQPSSVTYLSVIRKLKQCLFLTAVKVPMKMKQGPSKVSLAWIKLSVNQWFCTIQMYNM